MLFFRILGCLCYIIISSIWKIVFLSILDYVLLHYIQQYLRGYVFLHILNYVLLHYLQQYLRNYVFLYILTYSLLHYI